MQVTVQNMLPGCVLFSSCLCHNKELKGGDAVVRRSGGFVGMHSEGGVDQSPGRQRLIIRQEAFMLHSG